jgi:phosphopantothenoylcysteine decarboxylase/phosphopantothenate--cysteine ligase
MSKTVVLGVTASIAIYKACDILRRLQDAGFDVHVVMTKEAKQLISPLVFESLSGNRVHLDMFEAVEEWQINHISLAQKASLVVVAPATANVIAKIACGICDDLLSCVICATKAPVLICPAMNEGMYKNRIVQANIKKLAALGYKFVEPRVGALACGSVGLGCLAQVENIVKAVKKEAVNRTVIHSAA